MIQCSLGIEIATKVVHSYFYAQDYLANAIDKTKYLKFKLLFSKFLKFVFLIPL